MINNTLPCLDRKKWEKIKAKILRKRTTPCTYVVMPCSYAMQLCHVVMQLCHVLMQLCHVVMQLCHVVMPCTYVVMPCSYAMYIYAMQLCHVVMPCTYVVMPCRNYAKHNNKEQKSSTKSGRKKTCLLNKGRSYMLSCLFVFQEIVYFFFL